MNSGSRFLAEMSRTVSSFSPLGKLSDSTSETKPHLYSPPASSRIVFTSVLMALPQRPAACALYTGLDASTSCAAPNTAAGQQLTPRRRTRSAKQPRRSGQHLSGCRNRFSFGVTLRPAAVPLFLQEDCMETTQATTADGELALHLYDLRRETEMRKARNWFGAEFWPRRF